MRRVNVMFVFNASAIARPPLEPSWLTSMLLCSKMNSSNCNYSHQPMAIIWLTKQEPCMHAHALYIIMIIITHERNFNAVLVFNASAIARPPEPSWLPPKLHTMWARDYQWMRTKSDVNSSSGLVINSRNSNIHTCMRMHTCKPKVRACSFHSLEHG